MSADKPLGSVIQGSLSEGLEVRLHPDVSVEDMRVGKFLVVRGVRSHFFCMLTDVSLGTSSPRIMANPPLPEDDFLQAVLAGSGTYGTIELSPMLMLTPEVAENGWSPSTILETESKKSKKKSGQNSSALASYQAASSEQMELLPVKTIN